MKTVIVTKGELFDKLEGLSGGRLSGGRLPTVRLPIYQEPTPYKISGEAYPIPCFGYEEWQRVLLESGEIGWKRL